MCHWLSSGNRQPCQNSFLTVSSRVDILRSYCIFFLALLWFNTCTNVLEVTYTELYTRRSCHAAVSCLLSQTKAFIWPLPPTFSWKLVNEHFKICGILKQNTFTLCSLNQRGARLEAVDCWCS